MKNEILKELRLNPEIIARDKDISIGLAKTYPRNNDRHEDKTNALMVAATYFRRAAANALLLGSYTEAKDLFLEAARNYQSLGLPYSVVVAALSSGVRSTTKRCTYGWLKAYYDHKIVERFVPQLAYVVLALSTFNEYPQISSDIQKSLDPYRLRPLGVLGISVGTMLDLFDSLVPDIEQRKVELAEAMAPFFGAYNAAIRQTMQNHYHWERLALPFHPAEPDVYGVLTLVDSALRAHHEVRIQKFIEQAAIATESKNLLSTILMDISIYQQDRQDKQDKQDKDKFEVGKA
jgi:hypothetical protein